MVQLKRNNTFSKYYNAGIGFYRNTPEVKVVVADWQRRWAHSWNMGDDCDQLALNCSLQSLPIRVHELPPEYNAMVLVHPSHAKRAKIYHFFAGNNEKFGDSLFEHLIMHFEINRLIDWDYD